MRHAAMKLSTLCIALDKEGLQQVLAGREAVPLQGKS